MLDHADIVAKAIQTLRDNLDRNLVGRNLLPEKFTMKELQQVYEAILGVKLDVPPFNVKCFRWIYCFGMRRNIPVEPIKRRFCIVFEIGEI